MDGYSAVLRIAKERPDYLALVRKCVEAHHRERRKEYSLGFEWHDVGAWPAKLLRLATEYEVLEVTYKSNSATCYMVRDIEGVEKALKDIEENKVATQSGKSIALKVWLSEPTMKKLRAYIAREFPDNWDAENIVVERALVEFLDRLPQSE
jgi:hypothetical protein